MRDYFTCDFEIAHVMEHIMTIQYTTIPIQPTFPSDQWV